MGIDAVLGSVPCDLALLLDVVRYYSVSWRAINS